jgi:hypothetical protein
VKQPWTRLGSWQKVDPRFREAAFRREFMKHHRQACELVFDKEGYPMAAIYFTPQAMNKEQIKAIFQEIRRRTLYGHELEQEP